MESRAGRVAQVFNQLLLSLLLALFAGRTMAADDKPVRVLLSWIDQAQFAGFYVAENRGYFAEEGVAVTTLAGGPRINPLDSLREGTADVAILHYITAQQHAADADPLVNIAQVFEGSALLLICRRQDGIHTLKDAVGKTIGTGNWGDRDIVAGMLESVAPGRSSARYVSRGEQGAELLEGSANCITGMIYNEYLRVLKADVSIFRPSDYGVGDLQDGLYVLKSRLADPVFVDRLARMVRGLRDGWEDARRYPNSAVEITLRKNPSLDRADQAAMLESVLTMLPEKDLLHLQLADIPESLEATSRKTGSTAAEPPWTHAIWNRVLELDGKPETFTRATLFHVSKAEKSELFNGILLFGFCVFALAATLDAVSHGYDLWGRLVIAWISVMGGGILRDLILARGRLPFGFLQDPTVPVAITAVVVGFSVLYVFQPDAGRTRTWLAIRRYSEAIGFAIITVYGATACILSGSAWYWAPAAAAITVAGGGILRDIIVNREPRNFRGAIYEEVAVLSGLLVVAGLVLANRFEHSPRVVHAVLVVVAIAVAALRLLIDKYQLRYPHWLAQPQRG